MPAKRQSRQQRAVLRELRERLQAESALVCRVYRDARNEQFCRPVLRDGQPIPAYPISQPVPLADILTEAVPRSASSQEDDTDRGADVSRPPLSARLACMSDPSGELVCAVSIDERLRGLIILIREAQPIRADELTAADREMLRRLVIEMEVARCRRRLRRFRRAESQLGGGRRPPSARSTRSRNHNLRVLSEDVESSSRTWLLGQFCSDFSHALNQSLQVITTYSEILRRRATNGDVDPDAAVRTVDEILAAVAESGRVIGDFRRFTKFRELEPGFIRIRDLSDNAVRIVRRRMGSHIDVDWQDEARVADAALVGDGIHLTQVLVRLLIDVSHRALDVEPNRPRVLLRVRPAESRDSEFEFRISGAAPPHRIPDAHGDSSSLQTAAVDEAALGLLMCDRIIRAHQGTLWLEADSDNECLIAFRLPSTPSKGRRG